MQSMHNIPIQRKLRVVFLITCTAALIVACSVLFAFQYVRFRQEFERDLSALASIVASNCTGAISFGENAAALETLRSLSAKPHIVGAQILLPNGRTFAKTGEAVPPPREAIFAKTGSLHRIEDDYIFVQPIVYDGERLGVLVLHPDYAAQVRELIRVYLGIAAIVIGISFLVAALISWRLERVILNPIRYLAEITQRIAAKNDYSVRAVKFVDDEIGSFTDSFNSMLDYIERRDRQLRHEIAERTRAEEELQQAHAQLMDASRYAGMAEVATGVLHNVGNVLNSVNVSATLIAEKLTRSRVVNLGKAVSLLREQNGSLVNFLSEDPKGRLLPEYLAEACDSVSKERSEALKEVTLLAKNIDHIKSIVARQQTFARVAIIREEFPLDQLVDEALRMCVGQLENDEVAVIRDYQPIRPVLVDKHKVLQIVVNITRNAIRAMRETPPPERKLAVSIGRKNDTHAFVRISDRGSGIPPENLTKIFSHGFTTHQEGHGFGLHSAALAAQQMEGALSAESPGAGQGASFTLEIPFAAAQPC